MATHDPRKARKVLFYSCLFVIACLLGGVALRRFARHGGGMPDLAHGILGTRIADLPKIPEPVTLPPLAERLPPAVVVDVQRPEALMRVLGKNAWLQDALAQPVGQGFFGSWLAFLHTRGDSIGAGFRDTVMTFLGEQMLGDQPTRVVLFGGDKSLGSPVVVLPSPSGGAKTAFASLSQAVQRGSFTSSCPVMEATDGKPVPSPTVTLERWLIADRPVYAANVEDRMVVAITPAGVMQGLCTTLPPLQEGDGQNIDVTVNAEALGREAQLLAALLGVGPETHAGFALTDTSIVPRGLSGTLTAPRLGTAPLSQDLLAMVPEDAPVLVGLQLRLPTTLTRANLKAAFAGPVPDNTLTTRSVALLWYPHGGNGRSVSDLAILWPRMEDKAALQEAFAGSNALYWHDACGHLVMASNEAMFNRINATCTGHHPSILHAAPTVAAGLAEPTSVTVGMHIGRFLAKISRDAYFAEYPPKDVDVATAPPEIEAAARTLLDLPWMGLRGVAKDGTLQPGGFRS